MPWFMQCMPSYRYIQAARLHGPPCCCLLQSQLECMQFGCLGATWDRYHHSAYSRCKIGGPAWTCSLQSTHSCIIYYLLHNPQAVTDCSSIDSLLKGHHSNPVHASNDILPAEHSTVFDLPMVMLSSSVHVINLLKTSFNRNDCISR
eukprot:GHRR01029662.1.p1 GENE.GHRR01029662.1~~GHRR01029662.1.p1  ORF type:complete len:147 (-),score=18.20 GHRR01029662.1:605-1045(-)